MAEPFHPILIAIAWCAGWGEEKEPHDLNALLQMRQALSVGNVEDICDSFTQ